MHKINNMPFAGDSGMIDMKITHSGRCYQGPFKTFGGEISF